MRAAAELEIFGEEICRPAGAQSQRRLASGGLLLRSASYGDGAPGYLYYAPSGQSNLLLHGNI